MGRAATTRFALRGAGLRNVLVEAEPRTAPGAGPRQSSLDALRGAAMLLVVVAHVAVVYVDAWNPELLWAVRDPARSLVFDVIVWGSVGVAMPVFFTLSGFFAVRIYDVRGPSGFAKDRARRILGPFVVGGLTILPASLVVWGLGWMAAGRCTWTQFYEMGFLDEVIANNLFGPAHLWFLEYLMLMLAAYWVVRKARGAPSANLGQRRAWVLHPLAPFVLALPTALILWAGHRRFGLDGVTDLRNSFLPDPFRWAHHAWFFTVGTWFARHRDVFNRFVPHWGWRSVLATPALLVRVWLLEHDLAEPLEGVAGAALAVSGALFGWLSLFGLIGLAQRVFSEPRPAVRYLADSSYWIYLTHFPIVGLLQVNLAPYAGSSWEKFAIVFGVALAIGLASYHVLVRRTWLGRWLTGPSPVGVPAGSVTASTCPSRPLGLR